jgi:hypothetical protein
VCDALRSLGRIVFVGDSISRQHYANIIKWFDAFGLHPGSSTEASARRCLSSFRARFVFNKHLTLQKNRTTPFLVPWAQSVVDLKDVLVLNRGQHWQENGPFLSGWRSALEHARKVAPQAAIIARSTPPGAPNCHRYFGPVQSPPLLPTDWKMSQNNGSVYVHDNWAHVDAQAPLLEALVRSEFRDSVLFLDVNHASRLRPDCHRSSQGVRGTFFDGYDRKSKWDCLHYLDSSDVQEFWTELLLNALVLRNDASSSKS